MYLEIFSAQMYVCPRPLKYFIQEKCIYASQEIINTWNRCPWASGALGKCTYSVNLDAAVREGNEDIRFVSVTLRCISALHPLHKAGTNSNVQQSAYLGYQVRFSDAEMLVIKILGFLTNEHSLSLDLSALRDSISSGGILWCRNVQSTANACHYSMSLH